MGASPLGQYAPAAAAFASLGAITAFVIGIMFQHQLGLAPTDLAPLHDLAFLAAGTLFGSAVALNGVKAQLKPEIDAAHLRLDAQGAPSADVSAGIIRRREDTK